jgi:hypothetical protein
MRELMQALPFVLSLAAFVGAMWLLVLWERKQARTWTCVAEGEFDRIERGFRTESVRHGSMVHTTSYYRVPTTAVVLADGRSFVLRGRRDLPFGRGAKLRVLRNGLGSHRIERLDQ